MKKHASPETTEIAHKNARLDKLVFYGTVTITGASVMMVELLGTRIIGPFYGVSLIVWSSLLSVSLLALSLGYFIGGFFADRGGPLRLSHAVLAAGALIGIIPWMSEPVQLLFNGLGLRWGALSSAFVLFTPPLMFLGMAGPFVIRMATERLESVGSTAGSVYAISTVGSVLGTLLLGFYLLPLFGSHAILWVLAMVLAVLASGVALYEKARLSQLTKPVAVPALSALVLALMLWQLIGDNREMTTKDYKVIFEQETHYGWVRVVDQPDKNIRWLMSDASTIGAEDLGSGEGLLSYQTVVRLLPWFKPDAQSALLVGLGAGHLVNDLAKYGIETDSIEIDPAVAEAAQKYFSFKPTGKVIVGDARYRIKQLDQRYDLIIHDCFTGGAEPFHLLSKEMMTELKAKLNPGGVMAVNFVGFSEPEKLEPLKAIAHTLDEAFSYRKTYVSAPGKSFNDFIFIVSDDVLDPSQHADSERVSAWLEERAVSISGDGGKLITDDYNPLEFLQIAKAEYYRDILVERVGQSILFR